MLTGILALGNTQLVADNGPIYIRADGSIDPPTVPIYSADNMTYTLTRNITSDADGIVILRDNIMLDGAGRSVQGTGAYSYAGVGLAGRTNVTVKNLQIITFFFGIYFDDSYNNKIIRNNITGGYWGIWLVSLGANTFYENNIADNLFGIFLDTCSSNAFFKNTVTNSSRGIWLQGNCNYNIFSENRVTHCSDIGIMIQYSIGNTVADNLVRSNFDGIWLDSLCVGSTVTGNNVTNNDRDGLRICFSSKNVVSRNSVTNNIRGVYLCAASNNSIFHNNLGNNSQEVYTFHLLNEGYISPNVWDDGYPSGGNYWSNYNGTDFFSGPYQNETGSDEKGDTPYWIETNVADRYPLMNPYLFGDMNFDGIVDLSDAILMARAFGSHPAYPNWDSQTDLNNDNVVDIFDVVLLVNNFGKTTL